MWPFLHNCRKMLLIVISLCLATLIFVHTWTARDTAETSPQVPSVIALGRRISTAVQPTWSLTEPSTPEVVQSPKQRTASPSVSSGFPMVKPSPLAPRVLSPPGQDWRLTFQDDFDGSTLDATKWATTLPWGSRTNYDANGELQCYREASVSTVSSILRLQARQQVASCDNNSWQYTSGIINTAHAFSQRYGRFEARIKIPSGQGFWPAFWLLYTPDGRNWPFPPEIDVFEATGDRPDLLHFTTHFRNTVGLLDEVGGEYQGPNFAEGFHTVTLDWTPGLLVWSVDGFERFRSTVGVPDVPMYLILNLAVGGHWHGEPDETTLFPVDFQVDYVRVWQWP